MSTSRRLQWPQLVVGVFTSALGLFVLAEVTATPASAAKSAVGPGAFPAIIGFGLVAVGARLLYEAWARRVEAGEVPELDLKAAALGAAAFAAMILTLEWLGWIVAGTLMFTAVAWVFGSRKIFTSLAIGVALTAATYLLFDYGLDLDLPLGSAVEALLETFNPAP